MFDKLIDFLLNFIEDLIPFTIITEYNRGVLFRFGKFKKVLEPGIVWKIPFFDKYDVRTVITTTLSIPEQSLMTKDAKHLVVKAMVKYNISDIKANVLKINDPVDAISDTTQSVIKEQISERTLEECFDNELDNIITKKVRVQVRHWGVEIEKVTLTDIANMKSLRIFTGSSPFLLS